MIKEVKQYEVVAKDKETAKKEIAEFAAKEFRCKTIELYNVTTTRSQGEDKVFNIIIEITHEEI